MIFSYSRPATLLVAVGVMSLPLLSANEVAPSKAAPTVKQADPRIAKLHTFFSKLHCPVATLAEDFVRVADENKLDWRLLPSIAVVESGGGKVYKNNNIFGWNGGQQAFESVRSGLELVAFKLGQSSLYKRHDSVGKLHIYNQNDEYAVSVLSLMERISPSQELAVSSALIH